MDYCEFQIEKAFFLLNQGKILHVNGKNSGGEIWLRNDYFCYKHFGSSAVEVSKENLKWLFETIFESYNYIVFSDWEDINLSYICQSGRSLWILTDGKFDGYNPEL